MMVTERGASRSTLSAYEADLRDFCAFLGSKPIEWVTFQDIQAYLVTQNHLSPSTVARRLSSLRQLYTFLMDSGKTRENPLSLMETIAHTPGPSLLTREDIECLLEAAKTWAGAKGKRLSALLHILSAREVSVSELVSLPVTMPVEDLSTAAREALREYMQSRPYFLVQGQESPWLFPSVGQKGHLTRQRFGQLLKELALKIGLGPVHISLSTVRLGLRNYGRRHSNHV